MKYLDAAIYWLEKSWQSMPERDRYWVIASLAFVLGVLLS